MYPEQECAQQRKRFSKKSWSKWIKLCHTVKYSKYTSKYSGKFCPTVGNTGVISVRYQLPVWFVCTFIGVQHSSLETPHSGRSEYRYYDRKFWAVLPMSQSEMGQFLLQPLQDYTMRGFVVCPNWLFSFMPPLHTILLLSGLKYK